MKILIQDLKSRNVSASLNIPPYAFKWTDCLRRKTPSRYNSDRYSCSKLLSILIQTLHHLLKIFSRLYFVMLQFNCFDTTFLCQEGVVSILLLLLLNNYWILIQELIIAYSKAYYRYILWYYIPIIHHMNIIFHN